MSSSGKTVVERSAYEDIAVGHMLVGVVKLMEPCTKLIENTSACGRTRELGVAYATVHRIANELIGSVEVKE